MYLIGFIMAFYRECLLLWRRPVEWVNPLLFFILVAMLFPLTITPEPKLLQMIGPSMVWIAMLLAVLLSLTRLFQPDYDDGSLEQWIFAPHPLSLLILAKIIAHWLMLCVPVFVIMPLLAMMYHLTPHLMLILLITLLLGTPLLVLLGSIGAALVLGLRQSGLLLALILLPLYIPALIFATSAINAAATGFSATASITWLGVLLSLAGVWAPWLTAKTLKLAIAYR